MKVRILTENLIYRRGLLGEHGLSLLIEEHGKKFLFDAGQSDVYLKNAKVLKEDLTDLDGIILSHGHYDHCGGMEYFPDKENAPKIYIREDAFVPKWSLGKGTYTYGGFQWKKSDFGEKVIFTEDVHKICDGFILVGAIPYENDFEQMPGRFFLGEEKKPDEMKDEQILVVEAKDGLCLFLGCSHAGIINCLNKVMKEFPGKHIHSIFAGMHLKGVSKKRLSRTIEELKKIDFDYLIPVHCTGFEAIMALKNEFGEKCLLVETGKKLEL